MSILYREKSTFRRWVGRNMTSKVIVRGEVITVLRLRWWPLVIWLGHNLLILGWYMLAAIQGRTVMFNSSSVWYTPFRLVWQLIN